MQEEISKPSDKWLFVYWSIMYFGILCLLPWDIAVTVSAYWKDKFKSIPNETGFNDTNTDGNMNDLQKEFESYVNIAAGAASAPVVVSHLFIGHFMSVHWKTLSTLVRLSRTSIRSCSILRFIFSKCLQAGITIFFASMSVFAFLDTSGWQSTFMTVSLIHVVLINVCRSAFRATNSVNMGKFPVEYMSAISRFLQSGIKVS